MKSRFEIIDLHEGQYANLYVIKLIENDSTEFDKFIDDPDVKSDPNFDEFIQRLYNIADRHGCKASFFKDESTRDNPICALFHSDSDLRLYCIRYNLTLLIIGGGGLKSTRTYQEDERLNHCVQLLEDFWTRFDEHVKSGEIEISDRGILSGRRTL